MLLFWNGLNLYHATVTEPDAITSTFIGTNISSPCFRGALLPVAQQAVPNRPNLPFYHPAGIWILPA